MGLKAVKERCSVALYSDSKYLVDAMSEGWAKRWRANGWKGNKSDRTLNPDLWQELLGLSDCHDIKFNWVRGHSGEPENDRCDQLAVVAIRQSNLLSDAVYENAVITNIE